MIEFNLRDGGVKSSGERSVREGGGGRGERENSEKRVGHFEFWGDERKWTTDGKRMRDKETSRQLRGIGG